MDHARRRRWPPALPPVRQRARPRPGLAVRGRPEEDLVRGDAELASQLVERVHRRPRVAVLDLAQRARADPDPPGQLAQRQAVFGPSGPDVRAEVDGPADRFVGHARSVAAGLGRAERHAVECAVMLDTWPDRDGDFRPCRTSTSSSTPSAPSWTGRSAPYTVAVAGGRVVAVEPGRAELSRRPRACGSARSRCCMPGLVDTHVHLQDPGNTEWEDFESATRAAAAGGITTLVDMPLDSVPVTVSLEALEVKRAAGAGPGAGGRRLLGRRDADQPGRAGRPARGRRDGLQVLPGQHRAARVPAGRRRPDARGAGGAGRAGRAADRARRGRRGDRPLAGGLDPPLRRLPGQPAQVDRERRHLGRDRRRAIDRRARAHPAPVQLGRRRPARGGPARRACASAPRPARTTSP